MNTYKVVVTVPEDGADALRKVIGDAGGGKVGNYTHCSFSVKGVGRFLPKEGANPAIGTVGVAEEVMEERIEVTVGEEDLQAVVQAIQHHHPYEEPMIDVHKLERVL